MFRITECLSVGPFASPQRAEMLRVAGVTHVLNVSDAPSIVKSSEGGFKGLAWVPLDDFTRMPHHRAVLALDTLHLMASEPGAHVYVHCIAGAIRSPTVLWLYLIALGVPPPDARNWIEERSHDAIPGHRRVVDHDHVLLAQKHGLAHFFPHPRPNIIVPVPVPQKKLSENLPAPLDVTE
jgi:hypothetical protein